MKFHPNIFIVKDEYHIVIIPKQSSQVYVEIGGKKYYEENGGIIPTLDPVRKIKVPQKALDKFGKYTVSIRRVIKKECYFPKYEEEKLYNYNFKNDRYDDLKAYYLADMHGAYGKCKKMAKFFNDTDFIIYNGDFGETDKIASILKLNKFFSDVTKGEIPVLFVRGNHDTRGKYSEWLYRYVGMDGQKGYFKFSFRSINGIALDCGEDKWDDCDEYGGANIFEQYRREELDFLNKVKLSNDKYKIAVCHISFMLKHSMNGIFDIDYKLYDSWAKSLNEKNLDCMLCGHIHRYDVSLPSETDHQPHNYPVITGYDSNLGGMALHFNDGNIECYFAGTDKKVIETHVVKRQ